MKKLGLALAVALALVLPLTARADNPSDPACANTTLNCSDTSLLKATVNALGFPTDNAWVSGSGTQISLLKAIMGKLSGTLTVTDSALETSSATTATNTGNTATSSATTATNTGTIATNTGSTATNTASIATSTSSTATSSAQTATNTSNTATALGSTADSNWTGSGTASVIAALKSVALAAGSTGDGLYGGSGPGSLIAVGKSQAVALGSTADTAWSSGTGSVIALLKNLAASLTTTATQTTTTATMTGNISLATGAPSDSAWTSGSGSIVALGKGTVTALGFVTDAAWTSGNGSVIAILKTLTGELAASGPMPVAIGTQADVAWSSGNGTAIAILKNLAASLSTIATQTTTTATNTGAISTATGTTADAAYVSGNGTAIALLKGIFGKLGTGIAVTDAVEGTTADSAYGGSGSATVVSILKGIYAVVNGYAAGSTTSGQTVALIGCGTVSSLPTNTNGQTNPATCDTSGNINVHIQAGAGSGGTAMTDEGAFTQGTTSVTPIAGLYSTAVTNLTNGQAGIARLNNDRTLMSDLTEIGGAALALGQTTMSASVPVTIASNQSAVAVTDSSVVTNTGNISTATGTTADAAYTSGSGTVVAILKGIFGKVGGTLVVNSQAGTAGGATAYQLISANSNNATLISAGAHTVYGIQCFNVSTSAIAYIKVYDKATTPAPASDTPIKTIGCPYTSATGFGGNGNTVTLAPVGVAVSNGLGIAITGGIAANDNTSVASAQVALGVDYK